MTASLQSHPRTIASMTRRAVDVAAALAALIAFAPVILVIAILIRVDSRGPVFFRQLRLGRGGRHFRLYKFRKFYHAADLPGLSVTLPDDPRMTRIGRLLERSKLDELPQLWNILAGDMSLVGPRPETLDFADCFEGSYAGVLDHLPGLFGPSQAMFRNESALYPADQDPHEFYRTALFPSKARIDLLYYPRRSPMSDIGWIVRGVLAVIGFPVFRDGTLNRAAAAENWLRPEQPTAAAIEQHCDAGWARAGDRAGLGSTQPRP
jgi:lipopolysaccharide/colanic/teichoic acid biosynthesis glycosyltransferase